MQVTLAPRDRSSASQAFAGRHILICGASGNLGTHLACQLAPFGLRLTLWGRKSDALERLAIACRSSPGTSVTICSVDIADIDTALADLREADDAAPFDAAFFVVGAGDTRETDRRFESAELVARLGLVNYVGPAALAAELGERMAGRGGGRIILVGSAAASHPLPFAAAYASSKAGLSLFADSLRLALKGQAVSVTLASPGFFRPVSQGAQTYARPGEIAPELVAARIIRAAAAGRREVITPHWFLLLRWIGVVLPRPLYERLLLSLPIP